MEIVVGGGRVAGNEVNTCCSRRSELRCYKLQLKHPNFRGLLVFLERYLGHLLYLFLILYEYNVCIYERVEQGNVVHGFHKT